MKSSNNVNVCVLGDGGVGKTAVTIQLCSNHFVELYDPTIEDSYRKQMIVDNECYILDILDTAGQEEFSPLRDSWIRSSDGFVLIYSITDQASFEMIESFHTSIVRAKDTDDVPCFIVGNKCDLEDKRQVGTELAKNLALSYKNCSFAEISAKTRLGVTEVFENLIRMITLYYPQYKNFKGNKGKKKLKGCSVL